MIQNELPISVPLNPVIDHDWIHPIQPLKPIQRLGYLRYRDTILCRKSWNGFRAGQSYPVGTKTVRATWRSLRTNMDGGDDVVELGSQELAFYITNDRQEQVGFISEKYRRGDVVLGDATEFNHNIGDLLNHFEPPDVPDVARVFPLIYQKNLKMVDDLEELIRRRIPNFKFRDFQRDDCARGPLQDGLIVGWQTGLGKTLATYTIPLVRAGWTLKRDTIVPNKPILIVAINDLQMQIAKEGMKYFGVTAQIIENSSVDVTRPGFYIVSFNALVRPAILRLCDKFQIVAADEGTKVKGEETGIGVEFRRLNPEFRMLVTATPIKNRVPDLFWLAWWAAGGKSMAHRKFPYAGDPSARKMFTDNFTIQERNLSKESRCFGSSRKFRRDTAEACNLFNIWVRLAPILMRRRKCDVADQMVKKFEHPIYVPFGLEQQRVYREHLKFDYRDVRKRPASGKKLSALRMVAACPAAESLCIRSKFEITPKVSTAMHLIDRILRQREKVIVFSAFHEGSNVLSRLLRSAGVRHMVLDGREDSAIRAIKADRFKQGTRYSDGVMLAGNLAMGYGHSFPDTSNVISMSMDWAMDIGEQSPDRAWRLDSLKDLNFYQLIVKGSVEERIFNLQNEKSASSDLVLDGETSDTLVDELNINDVLRFAGEDLDRNSDLPIDEAELINEWESLKQSFGKDQMEIAA